MSWTPPPGTIGMTYSYGFTAFRAALGQALINESSAYSHAFIVLNDEEIIEPWPSGARLSSLDDYEDEYVAFAFLPDLSQQQCSAVAAAALSLDGIGYGLLDHLALAAHRYGWRVPHVIRRMANTRKLLPAHFIAETYRRAGLDLMPGFALGDIALGDLGTTMITSREWELRIPCVDFGERRGRYAR